jgi:eukaryotic-like serine/threonine-protein kinase
MPDERGKQERWQKIEDLYHSALKQERDRRAAYLAEACAGDASLELEVASLLAESDSGDGFLKEPALDVAATELAKSSAPAASARPSAIGRYRILRLLGEGGMGAVYEAEQEEPKRIVALKMLRFGLATPDQLRRFRQESQALARLQHPGIAQIYESNTADTGFGPQPYFAMELIRGLPLDEYTQTHRLGTRQRLTLLIKVCEAVHHAHQRGLIHRDLKPANIVVDETGQPKILDFGVARLTQADPQDSGAPASFQTGLGQLVGTLAYMSPEQVLGDPLEVDIRTDVYALGLILYQLLSGRLPYDVNQRQLPEAVQTIREQEPPDLRMIDRSYRGDIETIVRKALEKDKRRRYASAADLGADIQRYLADEPIAARPPSTSYQLQKFARRRRGLMAGVVAVFLVLVAGVAAATSMAVKARQAEGEARAVNDFLRNDLLAQAGASAQAGPNAKPDPHLEVRTALDRAAARIPGKFDKQPLVEGSIWQTIAEAYYDLGLYPQSDRQFERAIELRQRVLGEDNRDTLESMAWLAGSLLKEGKYAEAQPIAVRVLDIRRRVFGENDADTLASMHTLGNVYMLLGRYGEAAPLLSRSAEGRRKTSGEGDLQRLTTLNDLAVVYYRQGDQARTLAILSDLFEAERRFLGEENPYSLVTMNNLAILYRNLGNYAKAEEMTTKVLNVRRHVLGDAHSDTLNSLNTLAVLYASQGKYGLAEPLFLKALEGRKRVLGEEHSDTLGTMNALADLYRDTGRHSEAGELYDKALAISRRVLGADHPVTATTLASLGWLRIEQQRYSEAEEMLREALAIQEKKTPNAWGRYNTQSLLGGALAGQRKYGEAETLLVSAYQALVERKANIPQSSRPVLEEAGRRIVDMYQNWGKAEKAAEWREKLPPSASALPKP